MALSPESLERIDADTHWRMRRTAVLDIGDGKVVVKGQRRARPAWMYWSMGALARWIGLPMLAPVPRRGGPAAQAVEVRRLRALHEAGVRVPQVLHEDGERFVMQYLAGHTLHRDLLLPENAAAAFGAGLALLAEVHGRGQYLSQAFARNLIVFERALWCIDFEDDPAEVMSLEMAQARDDLAFLLSAVRVTAAPRAVLLAGWREHVGRMSPASRALLGDAARRLGRLRHLPRARRPWGRDVVSVQALGEFLHQWEGGG